VEGGGDVGIGIAVPLADLHVAGTARIDNMATRASDAFVITSDAVGNLRKVSWADASSALGDDLGDHTATTTLNMNSRDATFTTGEVNFGSTTRQMLNLFGSTYGVGVQSNTLYNRSADGFAWYRGGIHNAGAYNAGGGVTAMTLNNSNKLTVNGEVEFQGYLRADGGLNVVNTGSGFIHINNDEHYANGVFTPGDFRADGSIYFNEDGDNSDVRIKSATGEAVFYTDASNNNVGIGTGAPTSGVKLDVNGTTRVRTMAARTSDAFVVTSDAVGNLRKVSWADAESAFGDDLGDHILDQNLVLGNRYISGDGDNEGLRVNSSGQVYIGISPTAPFTVRATGDNNPSNNSIHAVNPGHGVGNEDAIISARTTYADGGDPVFALGILGAGSWSMGVDNSDDDKFKISNSYSNIALNNRLTIQQNGYVGIGVETTFAPLTIDGNNWNVRFGENTITPVQIYRTSMGSGGRAEMNFGKRGSANDAGSVRYMHQGDNNLLNRVEIGVFNNHDVLVANAAGNVGINESYPEGKFHIKEDIGTPASSTTGTLILEHLDNGGESSIVFFSRANASDYAYISYEDDGSGNGTNTENGLLTIGVENDVVGSGSQDDIALMPSGNVGIGTNAPSQRLHVIGNIFATGTVTSSDSTLKTNIERYDTDALTQIKRLNAVTYNWKASVQESGGYSNRSQIGFLAQEVKEVIPEAVLGEEGNGMGIDFNKVTPVIVKAMQEQQSEIERQKARIEKLEADLREIKSLLEK